MKRLIRLWLSIGLALALIASGCGDDDTTATDDDTTTDSADDDTTTDSADDGSDGDGAALDYDPEAVIRIPLDLAPDTNANFDPTLAFTGADTLRMVYDTLLQNQPDGSYGPGLAESFDLVDANTITLQLRPGLTFSDGTALDAEAAKESLLYSAAVEGARGFRGEYTQLSDVIVDGDTGLTLKFDNPVAGSYLALLAGAETMIVSPTARAAGVDIATEPVGAGPFLVESVEALVSAVLTKNPDYWDADNIKVAGWEFIQATGDAMLTGFRSNQLDLIPQASLSQIKAVENEAGVETEQGSSGNAWNQVFLCKSKPPFDDVGVRQALNYGIDRDALAAVMGESATPEEVVGSWAANSPFYDPDLAGYYAYDPDKAKQLLADAGYGADNPLEFGAYFTAAPDSQRMMEVLQQQSEDIGVKMDVSLVTDLFNQFLVNAEEPAAHIGMQRQGTGKVTRIYGTGSPVNVCQYNNAELDQLMTDLAAEDQATPSQAAIDLWHESNALVTEEALGIFIYFATERAAWKDHIGGVERIPNYATGSLIPDFFKLYVKAS